ncbi:MAG: histidine kinase [Candidatus Eisenbacteria bacterium]|nr:histidine kinase [Candidatus Eisenbacteria bacterium]
MKYRPLEEIAGSIERKRVPFSDLMQWRVRRILLVSSLYDSFTFQEDGNLGEMLFSEYQELNLSSAPTIIRMSTAEEAIEQIPDTNPDLVITMPRVGEMDAFEFGDRLREIAPQLPVALLAYDTRELSMLKERAEEGGIDRIFVWLGDARVFLAIIKWAEDLMNCAHDADLAGVKSLLLIEDSVRFYSAYVPMLYAEIMEQTQFLMAEGVNRMQQLMRMRARPKVLLASSYEEAEEIYSATRDHLLGVITDARFPHDGGSDPEAGLEFTRMVKARDPRTPVLVQSSDSGLAAEARLEGAAFCEKGSPTLLHDVRRFMREHLGFGDFVFQMPDGTEIERATDLKSLLDAIEKVPEESLVYHAERNDFSTWLMARTEFDVAKALRPRTTEEFKSATDLRDFLVACVRDYRSRYRAGLVEDFSRATFEAETSFSRIGTGSLGGKGRGLAFINSLLNAYDIEDRIDDVHICVPPSAIIATGVFERFMAESGLTELALEETDDAKIRAAFFDVPLPDDTVDELRSFLEKVQYPLAVRSSSLFEDSSFQPFAGIYQTYMIPNVEDDLDSRVDELTRAIRLVYASTYSADSKSYVESTPNRLEEERMAVVIQQIAGRRHEDFVYPNAAGVARSYDFYPVKEGRAEDGVASVALGLGRMVVEGGRTVRFSPEHPNRLWQFSSTRDYLTNSQREFYALDLGKPAPVCSPSDEPDSNLVLLDVADAARHGTLKPVASTYMAGNDRVYDGLRKDGTPLITMAGMLSGAVMPLPETLRFLLQVGMAGFTCDVEIEFAVNLAGERDERHTLSFLQIRPLVFGSGAEDVSVEGVDPSGAIAVSGSALGHGVMDSIRDIVYVRSRSFDRAQTREIAREIGEFNGALKGNHPYVLIGPGRWGSADPWLGIPVKWAQISGTKCIVEAPLEDIRVDPSQGTHFFQNITSLGIGYFTLGAGDPSAMLDQDWLDEQKALRETEFVRHIRCEKPIEIAINSKTGHGIILKPGVSIGSAVEAADE